MSDSFRYKVVFGLGGAWGFAPGDPTSPARAASAGAFTDDQLPPYEPEFTELRVHGVSGSSGPVMLEHPAALQVAGDGTTMFYRRWTPAGAGGAGVPWKLEAYSWGGLTQSPLASASWLLFAPFMLYNLAHFALPPQKEYQIEPVRQAAAPAAVPGGPDSPPGQPDGDEAKETGPALLSRDAGHAWATALLRLLAFSATLQFTSVIVSILVNSAGLQAPNAHMPSWLLWYPQWQTGGRVALALAGVAVVIVLMWLVSVRTAQRYEARISGARPAVNEAWPLTQTQFWVGKELVQRQRSLHIGGALAITALIVSRPRTHIGDMGGGRLALLTGSVLLLILITVTLCLRLADRHQVTLAESRIPAGSGKGKATGGTLWCRVLLAGGAVVFAGAFFTSGWPAEKKAAPVSLPGFTNACAFLLASQALLLVVLALTVWKLTRSAPEPDKPTRPFGAGHLSTIFAVLAVCLGGVFSAVTASFATRLIGTPVPSGVRFSPQLENALQIPWPIYAFGAAPVGLVLGLIISALWVGYRWNQDANRFAATDPDYKSDVGRFYGDRFGDADADGYQGCRKKIARAWAVGQLVTRAAVVALWAAAGMIAATLSAEIYAALTSPHSVLGIKLHGLDSAESVAGLAAGGVLIALLRSDYSSTSGRKTIGAIWDVGTFWPRAAHPLAPPCYAERAVPELVDRIRILTGTVTEDDRDPAWLQIKAHERNSGPADSPRLSMLPGPVLITGYSQGAIIASAVVAQLPGNTCERAALLTLACPARQLYGRAFPAYFGERSLSTLQELLVSKHDSPDDCRWKNLVRRTDYIGSWVVKDPAGWNPNLPLIRKEVDQPCWDPVTITADLDPTPPPIHRHTGWWQDPRVTQLGKHLGQTSFRLDPGRNRSSSSKAALPAPDRFDLLGVWSQTGIGGPFQTPPAVASRKEHRVHDQHGTFRQELHRIEQFASKIKGHHDLMSPPGAVAPDDDHAPQRISDDHILEHVSAALEDIPEDMHESLRMILTHPGEDTSLGKRIIDVVKNTGAGGWGEIENITKIQELIRRLAVLHMLSFLAMNSPYTYRVDGRLIRGSRPTPDKLHRLYAGGCRATINLCEEMDHGDEDLIRDADLPGPMDTRHIKITDNTAPDPAQVKQLFDHLHSLEGQVYIHCEAGVGRTGVMVACYRMATGWAPPEASREAMQFGCSVPDQAAFIENQAPAIINDLASTATVLPPRGRPATDEQLRETATMNKDLIGLQRALTP